MDRRDFLFGVPATLLVAADHSWAQLIPPLRPSPAVVNPVFRSSVRPWLSLDGEWDLILDPNEVGLNEGWFASNPSQLQGALLHKVNVPGAWEAQGVGKPGLSHATAREFARIPLRNEYVGAAWYRKTVTIPDAWGGKRIWLKVGAVNSKGLFWVNGKYIGYLDSYTSAGYKFEITSLLKSGPNTISAYVSNKINSHKGGVNWRDQFGGLYRSVELEATSPTYIDDVWVTPDFDNKRAIINVRLAAPWAKQISGDYRVRIQVHSIPDGKSAGNGGATLRRLAYTGTEARIPIVLDPFRPWSPEHPSLYKAEVTLLDQSKPIDGWIERFGIRKIQRDGADIRLNGKRYFLRGFGDDYVYPLTLSSPPSRDYHRKHLAIAHSYGFNYVRNHTHAENPEYYQAADEVGIMIQAELPYEGVRPSPPGPYQPLDDFNELCHQYRRYVSLTTYSMGNEGLHREDYRRTLFNNAKLQDPTRLVIHQDGGVNYEGISDIRGGPINVPVTEHDVEGTMPVILHEYLNLSGPPDPRLAPLYTGGEASPFNLNEVKEQVQKIGLEWEFVERAIDGGHELQSIYQKLGLENARSVPGLDGYDYWTIADVLALMPQGLLDPFWNQKRSDPAYFRQFNGEIALLLTDLSPHGLDRVLTSGDTISHTLCCSNYSENAIHTDVAWELTSEGSSHSHGQFQSVTVPQGGVSQVGKIEFQVPQMGHPKELKLNVKMNNQDVKNEWKFYCFPKKWHYAALHDGWATEAVYGKLTGKYSSLKVADESASGRHRSSKELLVTARLDEDAFKVLESGGKVLLLSLTDFSPEKVGARLGWWWPINNQRGTALAASEAFGDFPVVAGMPNFTLFRLLHEAVPLTGELENHVDPLSITLGAGKFVIPALKMPPWAGQVDVSASQGTSYLVNVFQSRVGTGRLFASGLNLLVDEPEANYLLDTFLKYVESPHFQPKKTIQLAGLKTAISVSSKPHSTS